MRINLKPDEISEKHPDLEHFSKEGGLEKSTDTVITELRELVSQAVDKGLSSKLEGDIVFCLRELEVHAQGIYHRSRNQGRSIFKDIKATSEDSRLKDLGIVNGVAVLPAMWRAFANPNPMNRGDYS